MSIQKMLLLAGLCVLFAGCSTSSYYGSDHSTLPKTKAGMGARYLLGRGAPQNNEKAFAYFQQGAREGDPFAQNELAYLYAAGKGTQRNDAKAFSWYQKAASHGLASAEFNLGLMYLHGIGTTPDQALGMEWIKKSAAHGFEPAKQQLAHS